MGFVSCLEDICERYYEDAHLVGRDLHDPVMSSCGAAIPSYALSPKSSRALSVIEDLWDALYGTKLPATGSPGRWEKYLQIVENLHAELKCVTHIDPTHHNAWPRLRNMQGRLSRLLAEARDYGPLSGSAFRLFCRESRRIGRFQRALQQELEQLRQAAAVQRTRLPEHQEVRRGLERLQMIREPLEQSLSALRACRSLLIQSRSSWNRFVDLRVRLAAKHNYRPALKDVDRFSLSKQQERYVQCNYTDTFRLQGASGSGKTVILIHRALRLAMESPGACVRIFTINHALADLLRRVVCALGIGSLDNLHIHAFYDFLQECMGLFEPLSRYRLLDSLSGERPRISWQDFYGHTSENAENNVFASKEVRELAEFVRSREWHRTGARLDVGQYLRDEVVYIQSRYRKQDRHKYLIDPRPNRSIPLDKQHRHACLAVLTAWEDYLRAGELCDAQGLTVRAAEHFFHHDRLACIRKQLPTDFVLLDEVQDFSTLELSLVRTLVEDACGPNRFFLAGDMSQKVHPKHHHLRQAGFDIRGKGASLRRNYRNTQEILEAARRLTAAFPVQSDDPHSYEVLQPELSVYHGARPRALGCASDRHVHTVVEIVRTLRHLDVGQIAVVSDNAPLLQDIRRSMWDLGLCCHELVTNEDLDKWMPQDDPLGANLVLSRLDTAKGFEFDAVVVCDVSEDTFPAKGSAVQERWRQAAVLYAALTRARDHLVITYTGRPSIFLKTMIPDLEIVPVFGDYGLQSLLSDL